MLSLFRFVLIYISPHVIISAKFFLIGNIKPDENPTYYRSPRQYIDICLSRILNATPEHPHDQVYELIFAKALESYYNIKNNNNQVN